MPPFKSKKPQNTRIHNPNSATLFMGSEIPFLFYYIT